jgi:hypothetical protein
MPMCRTKRHGPRQWTRPMARRNGRGHSRRFVVRAPRLASRSFRVSYHQTGDPVAHDQRSHMRTSPNQTSNQGLAALRRQATDARSGALLACTRYPESGMRFALATTPHVGSRDGRPQGSQPRTSCAACWPEAVNGGIQMKELTLVSTTPLNQRGDENRVYECDGRRISVTRTAGRFEFLVELERDSYPVLVIPMEPDVDVDDQCYWERVARAGLAYCE